MYNNLQKYKSQLIFIAKLLIITGAFYIISQKIIENKIFHTNNINSYLKPHILFSSYNLILLLLFTIGNWFFEITKWRTLVSSFKSISFSETAQQSLSSLTVSLLTPNRIGEYGAKAIYYPKENRKKILVLNFLSSFFQMFITIIFGAIGIIYLFGNFNHQIAISSNSILITGLLLVLILFLIRLEFFKKWISKLKKYLLSIPIKIHLKSLSYSFIRYLIFSHQFYFLLRIFNIELDYFTAMSLISSTYFIASFIPGFVVFDFIIKGSVAVSLFGLFQIDEINILIITTIMWLLNFALPSILGSYYVLIFKTPQPIKVPVSKK